ncbi:MAG: FG-GAP-like repeat-containing protein [Gemmataceae bacterium]|nr:FG-GAP-like repeat-containing protein [Gemmataceae bacterium]
MAGVQPTPLEQLYLERLNDIRANPAEYGRRVGLDLSRVAPAQPLAMDMRLVEAARKHAQDMNDRAYFGHNTPEGLDAGQRMLATSLPITYWSESIAAGFSTPEEALAALIVDHGVPDLGHRRHLLAMEPNFAVQRIVGIGLVRGGAGPYANYDVIDSAATTDNRAYLTGAVFRDRNNNGVYDLGEGLCGVTLTVAGVGSFAAFDSGGYSIPLRPGTYTVTATGPGFKPIVQTVTIGSSNVRRSFIVTDPEEASSAWYVTGADAGGGPHVKVFDARTGQVRFSFLAYDAGFLGGVRVAVGDVNGDGTPDIITAPGRGGGPHIRVFDGQSGAPLPGPVGSFMAYDPAFSGGVFIAAGDINGDGFADIITGADAGGGPHVQVFSGRDGRQLRSFMAYHPRFAGGVRVAAGDVSGDGVADILTAPGVGGGPHVQVFDGPTGRLLRSFMAFAPTYTGGLFLAAGDVNQDGYADILVGMGTGNPQVRVVSGGTGATIAQFQAFDASAAGGARVASVDVNGDGRADLILAPGRGAEPQLRLLDALTLAELDRLFAYDDRFRGGIFLG